MHRGVDCGDDCGRRMCVFSGGSGFNSVCSILHKKTCNVSHIIPVSDDGGSTCEIVRVIGGPAIGDIRSRLIRLADESSKESLMVKALLHHRLHSDELNKARNEWYDLLEGKHPLWDEIGEPYRETIRSFMVHFHSAVLMNSRLDFDWRNGSVGNFFFTGARMFFNSLEATIWWFCKVAGIPGNTRVIPAINSTSRITIEAELDDGGIVRGQNEISHPKSNPRSPLPSPISQIFFVDQGGHRFDPEPNDTLINTLNCEETNIIVYSMGSLYTSIIPSLILEGVGKSISSKSIPKILVLNGSPDRETFGMSAVDFINAITLALNRWTDLKHPPSAFISHLFYIEATEIVIDSTRLKEMDILPIPIPPQRGRRDLYNPEALIAELTRDDWAPR